MSSGVEWRGEQVERELRMRIGRNMDQAALVLKGEVQRAINRGNADGENPSKPGEPPKKVSGRLFQSIATGRRDTATEIVGVVGSNVEYARALELGTLTEGGHLAPRPYLRPTLARMKEALGRLLARS